MNDFIKSIHPLIFVIGAVCSPLFTFVLWDQHRWRYPGASGGFSIVCIFTCLCIICTLVGFAVESSGQREKEQKQTK